MTLCIKSKLFEYLSRKFVLTLTSLVLSFVLVWYDKEILGFVAAMGAALGFYQGGDSFQKYLTSRYGTKLPEENKGE